MYTVIMVNTIDEVRKMLFDQEYKGKIGRNRNLYVYRGLPDTNYELITSLQRICKHEKKHVENLILDNFAKYAEMEIPSINESIWRKMIIGQHHGLPTRLLDWSHSPLMAMHFATTESNMDMMDQRDCVVWRLDIEKIHKLLPEKYQAFTSEKHQKVFNISMLQEICSNLDDYDREMGNQSMVMLEPPTIDQRIANQYAFFSVVPNNVRAVEDILENCEEGGAIKYVINKNLRWEIRDMLDQVNINERTVYPGLDGIATWLERHYFVRNLSRLQIKTANIATMDADIIVNSSNILLNEQSGTSKAIFHYAGERLVKVCEQLSPARTGRVVVTDGYDLKARYIFHTIGKEWDGSEKTERLMRGLYSQALKMAKEKGCHSIAFPVLAAGFFGCPEKKAWEIGLEECLKFQKENDEYAMDITFCVIEEKMRLMGEEIQNALTGKTAEIENSYEYIDEYNDVRDERRRRNRRY